MGFFSSLASALGFGPRTQAAPTAPNGGDGVQAYGGYLANNEQNPRLVGQAKWTTYANAINMAIIATGVRYRCDLLAGAKWTVVPNERGGAKAKRAAEIVERGLLKAQMPEPWSVVVRRASLYKLLGFSMHEWVARRDDDQWVFADLAHRPQFTIDSWNKPSEQAAWDAIGQSSPNGNRYVIERGRLFYCVDNLLTGQPDGIGLMRHIVELSDQIHALERIEGFTFETDIRGTPISRMPFRDLRREAELKHGEGSDAIGTFVADRTQHVRSFVQNLIKSPDKIQYLNLDSSTYQGVDGNTISGTRRWDIELLKGDGRGLVELSAAITRKQLEAARLLGIEFVMMGGNSAGSHAQHASKVSTFGISLQTTLADMAAFATRDLARPLVGLNGLDVDTCTPTLTAEPISDEAVLSTCQSLQALAAAALPTGSPQRNAVLEQLGLPPEDAPSPEMAGMLGMARRGAAGRSASVQVPGQVEDLGAAGPAVGPKKPVPPTPAAPGRKP